MEESRPEADADSDTDTRSEQSIPTRPRPEIGKRTQSGALVSLLSKISATSTELVRALDGLRASIDGRVLGAIGGFRTGVVARMDASDAKSNARMDAHEARILGRLDVHEARTMGRLDVHEARIMARFDRLDAKLDLLRTELRFFLAVIALVIALLVGLIFIWRH